jgi:glycosyltransferase involved in cell wall biosynthesis
MRSKLLIVAPCLAMGGMERASVNIANSLNDLGIEVIFISLFKKEHFFKLNSDIKLIEPKGFNIHKLDLIKSVKWIRASVKQNNPDKILVFNKLYGAITALSLIGLKTPYYISERSSPLFIWKQPIKLINDLAFFLNSPEGVMAQTSIAASYQKKYYKKSKIEVIPNVLRNVKLFPDVKREEIILAVGRLGDHLKGLDLLIESFAKIKNKNWLLHIAGGDENGETLKQQAEKLGIRHRVKFLGAVKEIDRCYAYAGIYVIPSRSEGFPNALAEAMAAGCCCVAFDFVAGPRDLISHNNNGIIIPESDIHAMAKTIDELILDDKKRVLLGKNAMVIREKLNKSVIVEKIKTFIEDELILDDKKRVLLGKNAMVIREKLNKSVIVEKIKTFIEDEK